MSVRSIYPPEMVNRAREMRGELSVRFALERFYKEHDVCLAARVKGADG